MEIFAASDTFNAGGYKPAVVKSSDRCVGCLKCLYVCPDFAITISEGRPESRGVIDGAHRIPRLTTLFLPGSPLWAGSFTKE